MNCVREKQMLRKNERVFCPPTLFSSHLKIKRRARVPLNDPARFMNPPRSLPLSLVYTLHCLFVCLFVSFFPLWVRGSAVRIPAEWLLLYMKPFLSLFPEWTADAFAPLAYNLGPLVYKRSLNDWQLSDDFVGRWWKKKRAEAVGLFLKIFAHRWQLFWRKKMIGFRFDDSLKLLTFFFNILVYAFFTIIPRLFIVTLSFVITFVFLVGLFFIVFVMNAVLKAGVPLVECGVNGWSFFWAWGFFLNRYVAHFISCDCE